MAGTLHHLADLPMFTVRLHFVLLCEISEKYSIELNEQNEPVYATVEEHGEVILAIDKFGIAKFIFRPGKKSMSNLWIQMV